MSKIPKTPIYPILKGNIEDTFDKKTVAGCIIIALEKWSKGELDDVCFADILYTTAKKYADI